MNPEKADRRPICFSRYGGIGAGRYPIGFSGDTHITWDSLAYQPWFTATASNVLYGTWSHDIGGHMSGENTPELYTRWMQFGLFSPILRTHANKSKTSDRRVFAYPEPYCDLMMALIRERYDRAPYIYAAMRSAHDNGISLTRPMYYEHPDADEAYTATGQYYFGDDLVVAPVCEPLERDQQAAQRTWLPGGRWFDCAHGRLLDGDRIHEARYRLDEIPVFARAGAVIPGQTGARRLSPGSYPHPTFTIIPGADGEGSLYEDDGISLGYQRGESASITVSHRRADNRQDIQVSPADGSFDGFIDERPVDLILPGSLPPVSVEIDGTPLPFVVDLETTSTSAWAYDGTSATITVRIPSYRATRGLRCTITRTEAVDPTDIDGLKGLMSRLVTLGRAVAKESFFRAFFKDERFAVRVGQTGNRISRKPDTIVDELEFLQESVPKLPQHLRDYAEAYRINWPKVVESPASLEKLAKQAESILTAFNPTA